MADAAKTYILAPDMCYGRPGERPGTDDNVLATPPPAADPVNGPTGGLTTLWQA